MACIASLVAWKFSLSSDSSMWHYSTPWHNIQNKQLEHAMLLFCTVLFMLSFGFVCFRFICSSNRARIVSTFVCIYLGFCCVCYVCICVCTECRKNGMTTNNETFHDAWHYGFRSLFVSAVIIVIILFGICIRCDYQVSELNIAYNYLWNAQKYTYTQHVSKYWLKGKTSKTFVKKVKIGRNPGEFLPPFNDFSHLFRPNNPMNKQ